MLEFLKVQTPAQIQDLLKTPGTYNPLHDTWIVSDLKSKQEIQQLSVKRHGYYTDDAIMRVSDFWRLWIRRIEPTLQVVSSDFIRALVQHFVDLHGEKLQIADSEVSTLNKAVQEFAPILLHPASGEILDEWIAQQTAQGKAIKWRRWYQLARVCLKSIVGEKSAIDVKWSAAYLQTLDLQALSWPRRIFVDLGSELSTVEMGLFRHLAKSTDIVVITPDPEFKDKFPYLLNTYRENFGYGTVTAAPPAGEPSPPGPERFVRLSTQLAEVKFAVAQLRAWADAGVSPDRMAVIAADIEKYWPVLHLYLREEGLPCCKDEVARLNSVGDIQNFLAALKNYSQDVAWDSLEKSVFGKEAETGYRFEKFKSLFYQLYDEDDLGRDARIRELFFRRVDFSAETDRDGFLAFAVKVWMGLPASVTRNGLFEVVFKDFLAQSFNVRLRFGRWVQFMKNRLGHKEIALARGAPDGVQVLPLMSAQMVEATHRIYLGLQDEEFHRRQSSLLSLQDSMALRTQFDLAVDYSEESYLDFNLRWQSLGAGLETGARVKTATFYTCAHLSFAAEPLNACLFFIENSPASPVQTPAPTRLDELQRELAVGFAAGEPGGAEPGAYRADLRRLRQDLGGYEERIPSEVFRDLSVSDIEDYARCGFRLLAAKGFRLRDLPQVSLDLDPRQKGSLAHALFEFCLNLMAEKRYTPEAVTAFLDTKRTEFGLYRGQDAHWHIQRAKLLVLAQKFHDFEKSRLAVFAARAEQSFELFFDLERMEFSGTAPGHGFHFSFRIDRIDVHRQKKYAVIYDYKSSAFQVSNFGNWLSENQLQMLLYLMALELNPPADGDAVPVKGALYYQYKTFDLKKGLIEEEVALGDFGMTKRNRSLIDAEKLAALRAEFAGRVGGLLKQLDEYRFNTAPEDPEICQTCDWRKLCRAPHLM